MLKKILILLVFLAPLSLAQRSHAQCYGYNCFGSGYYNDLSSYVYFNRYATGAEKAAVGVGQFFGALGSTLNFIDQSRAIENEYNQRNQALENYKSVQRYYNEGIPPFANVTPEGKPKSPKITWQDVQSID